MSQNPAWIFVEFFEKCSQFKKAQWIFLDIDDLKFDIVLVQIFQDGFGLWTAVVVDYFYHSGDAFNYNFGDCNFSDLSNYFAKNNLKQTVQLCINSF